MENSSTTSCETRTNASRFCKLELPPHSSRPESRAWSLPAEGWTESPASPELPAGAVHLWRASLDISDSQCHEFANDLSPDEFIRARRLHFPKYQNRFIAGRSLLRRILSQYLDCAPRDLSFYYTPNGKPQLISPPEATSLQFNLAHSEGLFLLAVTRHVLIGVDVERIRPVPDAERIAALLFSEREYARLTSLSDSERDVGFFNAWTRKEACLKAIGKGLDESISEIEVTLIPGEPARLLGMPSDGDHLPHWSLASFRPEPGYIAALAALVPNSVSSDHGIDRLNSARLTHLGRNRSQVSRRFCSAGTFLSGRKT